MPKKKKFLFSPRLDLGGIGLLKNVGKDGFEILGQTGVFPLTYPDLARMALGWTGQNRYCPGARAAWRAKKFPF